MKCDDYSQDMTPEEVVELVDNCPPGPWPSGWGHRDNVIEAHRMLVDRWIQNYKPSENVPTHGRGIVIAGGGLKYMPSVWVHVHLIRSFGCNLPIQLWYLGDHEMDPALSRLLMPLGVECVNALDHPEAKNFRILCGWELKLFATWYSPWKEVLFLDADSCPVQDPEYFFDSKPFKDYGAIFWPDYAQWVLKWDVWRIFGIDRLADPNVAPHEPALESGQFIINKQEVEKEFRLSMFYAEHSDFTFNHVYGDKETFHLAWRKLNSNYAICSRPPGWNEHTIVQWDVENTNQVAFQHRVQDKWRLSGNNRFVESLANEAESFALLKELKTLWSGVLWENPRPIPYERDRIAELTGTRWLYHRVGFDKRTISLGPSNRITEGSAECEERWWFNVHHKYGPTLTLSRIDRPTCHLQWDESKEMWVGNWIENERMPVELSAI
jgi:hypothetical protein